MHEREHILISKALAFTNSTEIILVPAAEEALTRDKMEKDGRILASTLSRCLPSLTFDILMGEMAKLGCTKLIKQICPECGGEGSADYKTHQYWDGDIKIEHLTCECCDGRGVIWVDDEREEAGDVQSC